ncbi:TPA: hypothetical protein RRU48_005464 [Klebsiella pneumoniae]|uniref:hypothetical protein n=1 Tax=Klebsiella sp. JB_Kp029 TaxID=3153381 RepID=UPI0028CBD02B|nr:hypothetical protein [Klebsiella pneumoniae]
MEAILTIIAILLSTIALGWTIFRDNKSDDGIIDSRLKTLEQQLPLVKSKIDVLEREQSEMKVALKDVQASLHILDKKIERILGILESNK